MVEITEDMITKFVTLSDKMIKVKATKISKMENS